MPLRKDAKLQLLKGVPLFSQLSKRELSEVAKVADEIDFKEGKELTREGGSAREFFILLEGEADVRKGRRKLRTLRKGDFFGEIALVARSPRTATVTTTSPTRMLVVHERSFRKLLRDSPDIQLKVLQALAERLTPELV